VFVHTDGNGDPDRANAERVLPAAEQLRDAFSWSEERVVAVVPVRESEAWLLVDGEALRAVFETELSDAGLGLPVHAREVEHITEPKQALNDVARAARRKRPPELFRLCGQGVRLERLRLLPAFQRLEADLVATLRELRFVP